MVEEVVEVVERLLVAEVVLRPQHWLFLRICTKKDCCVLGPDLETNEAQFIDAVPNLLN
jgi:hypothetical protein